MTAAQADITILVDNSAGSELAREHGFSLWIEVDGNRVLFDTGQGAALPLNAGSLGIHPGSADALVLSHGHYDHTGGVPGVMQANPSLDVYCHPAAVQPRYSIANGTARPIHMPHDTMMAIDKVPSPKMHWISRFYAISGKVGLTGPIPRDSGREGGDASFFLDPRGRRPDPIEDDLALWIHTDSGLVVCVGCCHAGLINTLNFIRRLTGVDTIAAVIGGFHMIRSGNEHIEWTISELLRLDPGTLVPCHCTGDAMVSALFHAFPGRVEKGCAGMHLIF